MSQQDSQVSDDIDGYKYRVYYIDPLIAADIIADIGFLLAPVIGALGGVAAKGRGDILGAIMDGGDSDGDGDEGDSNSTIDSAIERAVIGFFGRMTKAKQRELFGFMIPVTMIVESDGKEPKLSANFTAHFRGRPKAMYLWFAFAMKTNFSDFFSGLDDVMSRVLKKPEPETPSQE